MPLSKLELLLKLPQGHCVLISPGYSSKIEANIPRRCKIKIPKSDAERAEKSKSFWDTLKLKLEQEGHQVPITDQAILVRKEYFLDKFPLPTKDAKDTVSSSKSTLLDWNQGL